MKVMSLRLPEELYEILREVAFVTRTPMNKIIIEAIKKADIKKALKEAKK